MKKLLITLLAISSLSAYAMDLRTLELSYSAEVNAGVKSNINFDGPIIPNLRSIEPSIGASYELTKNQMLSVNLGVGSALGHSSTSFSSSSTSNEIRAGSTDDVPEEEEKKGPNKVTYISLGIEYSYMMFEAFGVEVSIAPSFAVLTDGRIDRIRSIDGFIDSIGHKSSLTISLVRHIAGNLYVQLEENIESYIFPRGGTLSSFSTIGVKWMF